MHSYGCIIVAFYNCTSITFAVRGKMPKQAVTALLMPTCYSCMQAGRKVGERPAVEGIEVALNPEELDLDTAAMQAKYEQTVREQQSQLEKEDLSDMVAEHAAKQQKVYCGSWLAVENQNCLGLHILQAKAKAHEHLSYICLAYCVDMSIQKILLLQLTLDPLLTTCSVVACLLSSDICVMVRLSSSRRVVVLFTRHNEHSGLSLTWQLVCWLIISCCNVSLHCHCVTVLLLDYYLQKRKKQQQQQQDSGKSAKKYKEFKF
jgi:hypothetical protein